MKEKELLSINDLMSVTPQKIDGRKEATFVFFEELDEPYRTQAISNYNEFYCTQIPHNLAFALDDAFDKETSKEGVAYWQEFSNKIHKQPLK